MDGCSSSKASSGSPALSLIETRRSLIKSRGGTCISDPDGPSSAFAKSGSGRRDPCVAMALSVEEKQEAAEEEDYQGFESLPMHSRAIRRLSFSEDFSHQHVLIALVGLPARGKSYIAKKILNYSLWRGHTVKVFNVGAYRRKMFRGCSSEEDRDFFAPDDPKMKQIREKLAEGVLKEALIWLTELKGQIAVFDATNTTKARRKKLADACSQANVRLLVIESICDDPDVLNSNLRTKVAKSPDYVGMPAEEALLDLSQRIRNYEKNYESVEDQENLTYIKLINLQSKIICYHIRGYYPRLLVFFLMNLRVNRRPIWLTRAGHCMDINNSSKIQFTSELSKRETHLSAEGREFSRRLAKFLSIHGPPPDSELSWSSPVFTPGDYLVWTSTLSRALETVQYIPQVTHQWSALNMIDMGVYEGLTTEELQAQAPEVYYGYKADMKGYRFAGGESYNDVAERLEPLIIDLENQLKPVMIVSHLSALRVLYAYFQGSTLDTLPETEIPRHTVIELTPTQYGWQERRFALLQDDKWKCQDGEFDSVAARAPDL